MSLYYATPMCYFSVTALYNGRAIKFEFVCNMTGRAIDKVGGKCS